MIRAVRQFRWLFVASVVVAMVVALSASALPAFAGDPAPSATSRLTADELAVLKRRIAGWDGLDAATQERAALNALHLRGLSPEARARLLDRTKRADPLTLSGRMEKIEQFAPGDRDWWRKGRAISKVIAAIVVQALPADARAAFDAAARPPELVEHERAEVEGCMANAWMGAARESAMKAPPVDAEPSNGAPDGIATKFREAREQVVRGGGASAPPSARRLYAEMFLQDRRMAAKRMVPRPEDDGDVRVRMGHMKAMGAYLKEQFPAAFEAVTATVAEAARDGRVGLLGICERQADFIPFRDRHLVSALLSLEYMRRGFENLGGDVLKRADALEASILTALKVSEADVAAFQAARGPDRKIALMRMGVIRRLLGRRDFGPDGDGQRRPK